jgi:uncharacterized protein (DUF1800 family)
MLNQKSAQHLMLRAGFGASYLQIRKLTGRHPETVVDELLGEQNEAIQVTGKLGITMTDFSTMAKEDKIAMRREWKESVRDLNVDWIRSMVYSTGGLQEKMGLFWHDHFACSSNNVFYLESYLNTLRKHALGNFGELLHAIAKEPAMLLYLNNQQNRKLAPNENFAREVMELFTLGHDNDYTEKDIREVARAFTGWGVTKEGEFRIRNFHHDNEVKEVFGKFGNFGGEEVLDMLLEKRSTASYIAQKWVKFFVNEKGDAELGSKVAETLYDSGYEIKPALKVLFTHKNFYSKENMGNRIKSPVELIAGLQRMTHTEVQSEQSLIYMQKMLGQKLLFPPNVAGWHSGVSWIDNATLLFRVQLPRYIFLAGTLDLMPSQSADIFDQLKLGGGLKKLEVKIDQPALENDFAGVSTREMHEFFCQPDLVGNFHDIRKSNILEKVAIFTAKPEFQLC